MLNLSISWFPIVTTKKALNAYALSSSNFSFEGIRSGTWEFSSFTPKS